MDTFGARLRAAMLAKGLTRAEQLAALAKVSPQIVRRWLNMSEARILANRCATVAECLDVKTLWLATGRGTSQVSKMLNGQEHEMLEIAERLSGPEMLRWLACGHKIAGK